MLSIYNLNSKIADLKLLKILKINLNPKILLMCKYLISYAKILSLKPFPTYEKEELFLVRSGQVEGTHSRTLLCILPVSHVTNSHSNQS